MQECGVIKQQNFRNKTNPATKLSNSKQKISKQSKSLAFFLESRPYHWLNPVLTSTPTRLRRSRDERNSERNLSTTLRRPRLSNLFENRMKPQDFKSKVGIIPNYEKWFLCLDFKDQQREHNEES